MMTWSGELAREVRRRFNVSLVVPIPMQDIARSYGYKGTCTDSWELARWLGEQLYADDPSFFADELICPLYILEPAIDAGVKTGKKWFFGLFDKRRSWTDAELATWFGCSNELIKRRCRLLLSC